MSRGYDAIVVGGGIMGGWVSLELASRGARRVVLLERSYPAAGSTGKSSGILCHHDSCEFTHSLACDSLARYSQFENEFGLDIGYRQVGMALIADRRRQGFLQMKSEHFRREGNGVSWLEASDLRELEPGGLFSDEDRALWDPQAGFIHPVRTVHACLEVAKRAGVEVRLGTGVRSIEFDGDRVTGVRLESGEKLVSDQVINAAGPWANNLVRKADLRLPLRSLRVEQAYFEPPAEVCSRTTMYADLASGFFWKPEEAGWTRIGQLRIHDDSEVDPDHYDEGVSGEFITRCRWGISDRIPYYRHSPSWGGCGALQSVTPDALPIVGPVTGIDGLTFIAGFGGRGVKLAPAIASAVVSVIDGEDRSRDLGFFSSERFRGTHPIYPAHLTSTSKIPPSRRS